MPFVYDDDTGDFCSIDPTSCPQCKRERAFCEGGLPPLSDEMKAAEEEDIRHRRDRAVERERERGMNILREAPPVMMIMFDNISGEIVTRERPGNLLKRICSPDDEGVAYRPSKSPTDGHYFDNIEFYKQSTVGAPGCFRTSGILYCEIEITNNILLKSQRSLYFGVSLVNGVHVRNGASQGENSGIGDNTSSWGFNAFTGMKVHCGEFGDYRLTPSWDVGSVIGVATNLESGMIAVSKDGCWDLESGLGVKFEDQNIRLGVYPCMQGEYCSLRFDVGDGNVKYGPPPTSIWGEWAKYEDYDWVGLPEAARSAAMVLGYTQQTWLDDGKNPIEEKKWSDLSPEEQAACRILGYNEQIWTQLTSIWSEAEEDDCNSDGDGEDDDDKSDDSESMDSDDDDTSTSDDSSSDFGFMGTYWNMLPSDARQAAITLGYTQEIWDADEDCPLDAMTWNELTPEQQRAAIVLGYDETSWNETDDDSGSSGCVDSLGDLDRNASIKCVSVEEKKWSDLTKDQISAARILGYDERMWNRLGGAKNPIEDKQWDDLTSEELCAGITLGYNKYIWSEIFSSGTFTGNNGGDGRSIEDTNDHAENATTDEKKTE